MLGEDLSIADSMPTLSTPGSDLTGYEDGTENPKGRKAAKAAIVAAGAGLAGSSFVAVQRWAHDLDYFSTCRPARRDAVDRPPPRHQRGDRVRRRAARTSKRSTQEDFDADRLHGAPLHVRSRPDKHEGAGVHLPMCAQLDTFERQMRRMAGLDDGIADALFTFSRPVTGGYYWCPPLRGGRPDLRILGV